VKTPCAPARVLPDREDEDHAAAEGLAHLAGGTARLVRVVRAQTERGGLGVAVLVVDVVEVRAHARHVHRRGEEEVAILLVEAVDVHEVAGVCVRGVNAAFSGYTEGNAY
jgi:hypothetical protein